MLVLSWFPPYGIVIAGFLTGLIAARAREGAIMGAILAAVGALIQIAFVTKVLPFIGVGLTLLGFVPLTLNGLLLNAFGPLYNVFFGLGGSVAASDPRGSVALFTFYCFLGGLGGLIGGLIR